MPFIIHRATDIRTYYIDTHTDTGIYVYRAIVIYILCTFCQSAFGLLLFSPFLSLFKTNDNNSIVVSSKKATVLWSAVFFLCLCALRHLSTDRTAWPGWCCIWAATMSGQSRLTRSQPLTNSNMMLDGKTLQHSPSFRFEEYSMRRYLELPKQSK